MNWRTMLVLTLCLAVSSVRVFADEAAEKLAAEEHTKQRTIARDKGVDWLIKHQAADGSWGKTYTAAVTSFACLSLLSASDEPFAGPSAQSLVKGLKYLSSQQADGMFNAQGHSWIHGQGFATLALSEAYGRAKFTKTKPDVDTDALQENVSKAVAIIATNQSTSGGWWYTPGAPGQHEGSTTVCAVQALVSASNYGIEIDKKVLAKGFEYLKKCQNEDGGFDYQLGDTASMKEGTAADVATLGLMKKFDYQVMINGYKFLLNLTPAAIGRERFPYYGHFYGSMGMQLLGQEFKTDADFRTKTAEYIRGAQTDVLSWQTPTGSWAVRGWMADGGGETEDYATAFATLTLSVPEGRLSIYNRTAPKLPK